VSNNDRTTLSTERRPDEIARAQPERASTSVAGTFPSSPFRVPHPRSVFLFIGPDGPGCIA
jgi:hypothetical protein